MSFLSTLAGSSERKLPEGPSEEGSRDDSDKQARQRSLQLGTPNADWPVQRRYYDRKISRDVGPPLPPTAAFGPREEE